VLITNPDESTSLSRLQLGSLNFTSGSLSDLLSTLLQRIEDQTAPLSLRLQEIRSVSPTVTETETETETEKQQPANTRHSKHGFCIGYINPHVYNLSRIEPDVLQFINQCDLICLDGLGTCLALKHRYGWFKTPPIHRVVALQLFDAFMAELSTPCTTLLIGVETQDVEKSAMNMTKLNANLSFAGTANGFQHAADYEAFLSKHAGINLILIGAGTPKSESIATLARQVCPEAIVFHLGAGTVKVYAGTKHRAPAWVSAYGLEWAHRMLLEPHTRERYLKGGWRFIRHVMNLSGDKNTKSLP